MLVLEVRGEGYVQCSPKKCVDKRVQCGGGPNSVQEPDCLREKNYYTVSPTCFVGLSGLSVRKSRIHSQVEVFLCFM